MRRYKHAEYLLEWFIFDDKTRLTVSDHHINIDSVDLSIKHDPLVAPHLMLFPIGGAFLRSAVTGVPLPLTVQLRGSRVGLFDHNRGYDVAATGALQRHIESASVRVDISSDSKVLRLEVLGTASPLVRPPLPLTLNQDYGKAIDFRYEFEIPVVDVPELLNMDAELSFRFRRALSARLACATH